MEGQEVGVKKVKKAVAPVVKVKTVAPKVKVKADVPKVKKAAGKAPKVKIEKRAGGGQTPPVRKIPNAKIKILKKENPCREGTKRHEAFEALLNSKTVEGYRGAGFKVKYIKMAQDLGIIQLQ